MNVKLAILILVAVASVKCKRFTVADYLAAPHAANIVLPEKDLLVPQLVRYWGYPLETHQVVTVDGYYLTVHRIPHGKHNAGTADGKAREVFFLQHGLLCSSSGWLINLPHQSLGYMLADAGYDVWLGNVRGNVYSRKHSYRQTNSSAFWSFSFAEHAKFDLPAMINYVLQTTKQDQLFYAGHSMGCMMTFAGLENDMRLQKKFKMIFALAPPTRLSHVISPIKYLASLAWEIKLLSDFIGIQEFLPSMNITNELYYALCSYVPLVCKIGISLVTGYDLQYLNTTRLPVYATHCPAGTSTKNMLHFAQLINDKKFQKFDYGVTGNYLRYFQKTPPEYQIANINVPYVLFYGTEDWLVPPRDVQWAIANLPNVYEDVEIKGYNHMDFLWATNAAETVYHKVIQLARNFIP